MTAVNPTVMDNFVKELEENAPPLKLATLHKASYEHPKNAYAFFLEKDAITGAVFIWKQWPIMGNLPLSSRAGLSIGDVIIEVNHGNVQKLSIKKIWKRMGEKADHVTLLVASPAAVHYYGNLGIRLSNCLPNVNRSHYPAWYQSPISKKLQPMSWTKYLQFHLDADLKDIEKYLARKEEIAASEAKEQARAALEAAESRPLMIFASPGKCEVDFKMTADVGNISGFDFDEQHFGSPTSLGSFKTALTESTGTYYSTLSVGSAHSAEAFLKELGNVPIEVDDMMPDYRTYQEVYTLDSPPKVRNGWKKLLRALKIKY